MSLHGTKAKFGPMSATKQVCDLPAYALARASWWGLLHCELQKTQIVNRRNDMHEIIVRTFCTILGGC